MKHDGRMEPRRPLPFDPIATARAHWAANDWHDAAPGMAAVTSVMRAHQLMLAKVEKALRPFGLTFARYEVLMLLSFTRQGEIPMARASSRLQVHPTSITNAVDRLEEAGLVRREPHPDDRRTTLIRITDEGRRIARSATDEVNEQVFAALPIAEEDIEQLVAVLTRFRSAAGDFTDSQAPSGPAGN